MTAVIRENATPLASRRQALPAPGDLIGDKFRLEKKIGAGGMGAVYAATNVVTGKQLALKWLVPAAFGDESGSGIERFVREAQAAARIHHPHVVDVYDVGTHAGGHFLVMELLRGEALSAWITRGRIPYMQLLSLVIPAIRAIGVAHRHGVVHRDLKPDNIFVCKNEDGTVWGPKVLDFGISKIIDEVAPSLTQSGTTLGTPYYMSPEQVRSLRHVDARTDVYALGVILYEGLTGRVPFTGESYGAIAIEIATGTLAPPSELEPSVPPALEAIVLRALARDVTQRIGSADELADTLSAFVEGRISEPSSASASAPSTAFVDARRDQSQRVSRPMELDATAPKASTEAARTGEFELPVTNARMPVLAATAGIVLAAAATISWWASRAPEARAQPDETRITPPPSPRPLAAVTTPAQTPQVASPPRAAQTPIEGETTVISPSNVASRRAAPQRPGADVAALPPVRVAPAPVPAPAPAPRVVETPSPAPAPRPAPDRGRTGNLNPEDFM